MKFGFFISVSHPQFRNNSDCETTATIYYGKLLNPNGRMFDRIMEKNYLIPQWNRLDASYTCRN